MRTRPIGQTVRVKRNTDSKRCNQYGTIMGTERFDTPGIISLWYQVKFRDGHYELFEPNEIAKA